MIVIFLLARNSLADFEQWGVYEITLHAPAKGNPFSDVTVTADFSHAGKTQRITGFYDGDDTYRIRFMPDAPGDWSYETKSATAELNGKNGTFKVLAPSPKNHGPVRVANTYHFAYADGTRFIPFGTTCYNWAHQSNAIEEQTLKTLAASPFNKMRMCIFPTAEPINDDPAERFPYVGTPPTNWDATQLNPKFFQYVEKRIRDLGALGIEADVILFHPYGKEYGFSRMPADVDDRYVRYVVARLGAYRNVWWSMANEYDFVREKTEADYDRLFQVVQRADPFDHLRSIHNGTLIYDNNKPWITHASIQNGSAVEDSARAVLYRDVWRKPVVFDEVKYEGNVTRRWGQLTPEEMTHRIWEGTIAGTYVMHGEVIRDPSTLLWGAQGGALRGQSAPRIAFLKKILEAAPDIDPIDKWQDAQFGGKPGEYYLTYFGKEQPTEWKFVLPKPGMSEGLRFHIDLIDTWNMTITPVDGEFVSHMRDQYSFDDVNGRVVKLPGTKWIALRIERSTIAPATRNATTDSADDAD